MPITWGTYAKALTLAFVVYMGVGIAVSAATGTNAGGLVGLLLGVWGSCWLLRLRYARAYVAVAGGLLAIEIVVTVALALAGKSQ